MANADFTVKGLSFKLNKINAFRQFHIVRRIAPIMGDLIPAVARVAKKGDSATEDDQLQTLAPIMTGISKLTDKDADYVLIGLLSGVEIQQAQGNWAPVVKNDIIMFQDLDLPVLLEAAGRSFMFNMASFFDVLQRNS